MKKADPKKDYSNFKGAGKRNNFERAPRSEKATLKHPYKNKNTVGEYIPKAPYIARVDKPVYKGKEDRLAGTRTRSETRAYSGYSAHSPKSSSSRAYTSSKSLYSKPVTSAETEKPRAKSQELKAVSDTSWGGVADWYNKHLEKGDDTYHSKVIFPNILRMLGDVEGKKILDIACGQGIFSEQLRDKGAFVTGIDLGKELIKIAEEKSKSVQEKGTHKVIYHVASADDLFMLKDKSFDIVVCILALQNIEDLHKTMAEARRVLPKSGKLFFVLNHPSYRNPKQTYWGYNEADNMQYRRVDEYMSESHVRIDMTPGSLVDKKFTVSFHRPLQVYIKALSKNGFAVTRLEEWVSHRESERGPRKKAEDKARKEIPLFMCIESVVIGDKA
jgi:ubiquinone/menaquinone biosynthesis C-methylase UbiE